MTAAELERLARELGLDVVGAAPASAYEETERHIRERRARGLFADMRFTMAQPEISCHPETLLEGARTVVSAALCYYGPAPPPGPGRGRLPRYTWLDAYAKLREQPDTRARRARNPRRDDVPLLLDAGACLDPRGVPSRPRRPGLRLRHLPGRLPLEPRRRAQTGRRGSPQRRRARRLPRRVARGVR